MSISKTKLIGEWIDAKSKFDFYKKQESELRIKLVEQFFPTAGEGTHNIEFRDVAIKATVRFNYKFNVKELEEVEDCLTDDELACIKRNPTLDVTKFKNLGEECIMIHDAVVITPGLPTLVIKVLES